MGSALLGWIARSHERAQQYFYAIKTGAHARCGGGRIADTRGSMSNVMYTYSIQSPNSIGAVVVETYN